MYGNTNDGQDDGIVATASVVDGEGVSVGDTNIVVRDGFHISAKHVRKRVYWGRITIPASAFVDEASCGVPDKPVCVRLVWKF